MTTEAAERNVLENPYNAREWDQILGNNRGELIEGILAPLSTSLTLLRLKAPVHDARDTVAMVVEDITGRDYSKVRREVRFLSATDIELRAEVASQQDTWPSVEDKLDFFVRWEFMRKYTDQIVWKYAFTNGDTQQFIKIGENFFNRLGDARISNKFAFNGPLNNLMWRTLVHSMKLEAMLAASGKPDEAAEMGLIKDLCLEGNYPLGVDKQGLFVVLTA